MALAPHHGQNLDTLKQAFRNNDVAILEYQRKSDLKTVALLVAVGSDNGDYTFTPFAEMIDGNPFELYNPPNPNGGFLTDIPT